jgi:putative peptidoglycan lipid II flippase
MSLAPVIQRVVRVTSNPTFRALFVTGLITAACKVVGFGRELVVAGTYGASAVLDAFLVAVVLPNLLLNAVSSAIGSSLLPRLIALRLSEGPAAEQLAQRRSAFWTIVLLGGTSIACALLGPWLLPWLSPGFTDEHRELTRLLLWSVVPYSVIAGTTQVWAILANSEGRFAITAASPGIVSIVSIAVLVGAGGILSPWPLVIGLTLGSLGDLALTAWTLRGTRYSIRPMPSRLTAFERGCWPEVWPMSLGALLHTGTLMIGQAMASLVGPGTISELNYGNRLVAVVASLVGLTVSRVAFPQFSRLAAEKRYGELGRSIRRFAGVTLAVSVPSMIVLSAASGWIVDATFTRGQFTAETAARVGLIQAMFALQLPFYLIGTLLVRAATALGMNRLILWFGAGSLVLNAGFNVLFAGPLGAPGLALATSIVYFGTCLSFAIAIGRKIRSSSGAGASLTSMPLTKAA